MARVTRYVILLTTLGLAVPKQEAQAPRPNTGGRSTQAGTVSLRLLAPRYRIAEVRPGRHRIYIEGFARASEPGAPALPFTVFELEVPDGVRRESLRLQTRDLATRAIPGTYSIEEAATAMVNSRDPIAVRQELAGVGEGRADALADQPFTILGLVTRWEGNRRRIFARILYNPIQVRATTLRLTTASMLELRYELLPRIKRLAPCARFDYVIVTTRAIRDASTRLDEFVWHKESLGFSVRVITEDDYESLVGPYPDGRAERIRKWLQTHYQEMGIRYVLLIGNPEPDDPMYTQDIVGDIPMKQVWHRLAGERSGAAVNNGFFWGDVTDWYYADLTGNWDVNGDGFYGVRPWLRPQDVVKSPLPAGIPAAGFSARWTGTIAVPTAGTVMLQLEQWPKARVFVDDVLIIDHWTGTPTKSSRRVEVPVTAGAQVVRVEYAQPGNHGHIRFQYQVGTTWSLAAGFAAEYFTNPNLQGTPAATVPAEDLERNWENSDHAAQGGVDLDAEVAVGRIPVFDGDVASLDKTLDRIIGFETGSSPERNNILVAMKPLSSNTPLYDLGEAIVNDHLLPARLHPYRVYEANYGLNPPPEATPVNPTNVTAGWNRGVGAVFTQSHGTARWTDQILDAAYHIPPAVAGRPSVTADHPAIAAFLGCHVGWPYLPDCYPGCGYDRSRTDDARSNLAISSLRETSVAVIAATEISSYKGGAFSPDPWRRYDEDLTYLYAREIARNEPVGEAMRRVHYTHFSANVDKPTMYHQQLIHVLYGDPSIRLFQPCSLDGSPCVRGDMRASWTLPGQDRPFIWENFVPKICQYVVDCPYCTTQGFCEFSATLELPVPVTLEVRDGGGKVVASSPRGTRHRLRFAHDPGTRYRLVVRDPQATSGAPSKIVRGIKATWWPIE